MQKKRADPHDLHDAAKRTNNDPRRIIHNLIHNHILGQCASFKIPSFSGTKSKHAETIDSLATTWQFFPKNPTRSRFPAWLLESTARPKSKLRHTFAGIVTRQPFNETPILPAFEPWNASEHELYNSRWQRLCGIGGCV